MQTENHSSKPETVANQESGEGCPEASCSEFFVWWLTEDDYHGFDPHQGRNPLRIPDYAWAEFCSLAGRPGRGRLWVPAHIRVRVNGLPVEENDPRWTSELLRAGGIVIEATHADDCVRWGGTITTLTLDPVDTQDKS